MQNEGVRIKNRLEPVYYRFTSSRILNEQKHTKKAEPQGKSYREL